MTPFLVALCEKFSFCFGIEGLAPEGLGLESLESLESLGLEGLFVCVLACLLVLLVLLSLPISHWLARRGARAKTSACIPGDFCLRVAVLL